MTIGVAASPALDRTSLIAWYVRNRARSRALFDLLSEDADHGRPIALRHPIVFYEGHLPAFSFNTLVKKGLGRPGIDAPLERLFARGIDPHESQSGSGPSVPGWPDRAAVTEFAAEADRQVLQALEHEELDRPGDALLDHAEAAYAILEHEAMHQETLLYMWHRLPFSQKKAPADYRPLVAGDEPRNEWIEVDRGSATLGVDRGVIPFGWDNEFPATRILVDSFEIERHDVTNGHYLEFVEAGGYDDERWWKPEDWQWLRTERIDHPTFWERHDGVWFWRGMFELIPLPLSWPVYVSQAEASAYALWRRIRLPTEAEFQRAAFSAPDGSEREHPWGNSEPTPARGVFDFVSWDRIPPEAIPTDEARGAPTISVGNGWKWTSSTFGPFAGFRQMPSYPEYSADFFDGEHIVMKGASPVTARELLRPTFRNWFRSRYPYVYATFRGATNRTGAR